MGSAVDETNLARELQRYRDAGLGGVHIIPIYGARGFEQKFIPYLSPQWMAMLDYTIREAGRLGMGVDMTTGSGWCFGGPHVTSEEANASVVPRMFEVNSGAHLAQKFNPATTQALMAFSSDGRSVDLRERLTADGVLDWSPTAGSWRVYAISQKPSGQKVKRAGPGGQGYIRPCAIFWSGSMPRSKATLVRCRVPSIMIRMNTDPIGRRTFSRPLSAAAGTVSSRNCLLFFLRLPWRRTTPPGSNVTTVKPYPI